jgi:uncharacterized RDD family membrane protein YckC
MTNRYDSQDDRLPSYGGYGQSQPGGYGQSQPGAYGQSQSGPYGQSQQAAYGQPQQGYGYGQPGQPVQPYGAPHAGYEASPAGYRAGYEPPADYANWLTRVAAYLVDSIPQMVLIVLAIVVLGKASSVALLLSLVFYLAAIGVVIYNRWIKAGQTGQSWGKQLVGVRLIDEETREPIGPLMAFVRDLAHIIDSLICYVGFLFPLWDEKRQTIADKIMHTVVVPAEAPYHTRGPRQSQYDGGYHQAPGQYPPGGFPGQGSPQQGYPQQGNPQQGNPQAPSFTPNPSFPGERQEPPSRQDPRRPQGQGYPQAPGYRPNNNNWPGPDNQQGNGYRR